MESIAAQAEAIPEEQPVAVEEWQPEAGLIQVKSTDGSSLADIKMEPEEIALIDQRAAAESSLSQIEDDLRTKLLELQK